MRTKLLSITENTRRSGLGHYMRQTALRNYLLKHDIELHIECNTDRALSIKTKDISRHLVLVDLSDKQQHQLDLKALDYKYKFCFDWSASPSPDVNLVVSEWADKEYSYKLHKYSGIQYFMVNEDVFRVPTCEKDYCLITIGAFFDDYILNAILKNLKTFYFNDILVIESGLVTNISSGEKLSSNLTRADYLGYLATAGLVVTNGGTTLVESLLLAKKIISVPKNKYELSFAQSLNYRETPFSIWNVGGNNEEVLMLNTQRDKLDGLGAERVGDMIRKLIDNED